MIIVREEREKYSKDMLDPRNDFVFKMLFGQKKNMDLLLTFLNAILRGTVEKVLFVNPYLEKENVTDKSSVMDIRVENITGEQINLEIQMQYHQAFPERMLMYWSRMHASQDEVGKELFKLKKSIQIVVTNFSYLPSDEFHSTFHIIEKDQLYIYTDHLEMHVLELPKMTKQMNEAPSQLEKWLLFLKGDKKTKEELAMGESTFQKAYDELDRISQDKEMRARALSRDMFLLDQAMYRQDAREEGLAEGREEGREEGKIEFVKLLHANGSSPSEISTLLGLPVLTIEQYLSSEEN